MLTPAVIVVLTALIFEYINVIQDVANSIATAVATNVLSPMQATMLAALTNLIGSPGGTAVARRSYPASAR